MPKRIRLLSWNQEESRLTLASLRKAGYVVSREVIGSPEDLKRLRQRSPDALVIDLSRLPSHGRDVALAVRVQRATRFLPIVFLGGDPQKVEGIRALLPDAVYTQRPRLREALRSAIRHRPDTPVIPPSALAGYAGKPLPQKLGIRPGITVVLEGAPGGFADTVTGSVADVLVRRSGKRDLTVWFCRSHAELAGSVAAKCKRAEGGKLWIAWPKKGSPLQSDIGQTDVRKAGLGAGWVDYKICAIDNTWSALLFTQRKVSGRGAGA